MSDQNITGKKDNLQTKILARLQSTKAMLEDYSHKFTLVQRKILFSVYENQLYRTHTFGFIHIFTLLKYSFAIFGINYTLAQLKSVIFKFFVKNK